MKTSYVSNLAIQTAMRMTIQQNQMDLLKATQEQTTGRHYDVGLTLGATASRSLNLQREIDRLNSMKSTNSVVTQRLSGSQGALETMAKAAEKVRDTLVTYKGNDAASQLKIQKTEILGALQTFTAAANTSFNGEFLFSGINTDAKPLADYTATSAAKTAFDAAFTAFKTANSITSDDQITVTQMQDFIKNTVEPMFTGTGWDANWSDASSQNMTSRISASEVIESSTNANTNGFRMFALASVITAELMDKNVTPEVRAAIGVEALQYAEQGIAGLNAERSQLGISESRVKKANTSIDAQLKLVNTHVADLEGIDPIETSTRINTLKVQLETSYTLTSRLQQMSLLNFL
ncbi:flagellar hook-associated family protein [Ensifer sp. ENS07]|jgi:flagellar hook-associated protein 3 FlgL|uniref:Flagellin n=1 Tax=Ensifer adhaerens TaxID=106592 RepID=A0A9Q9DA67_ENSAD|nr:MULTISPECIES: flagellar hook-associated family protein [Ensifer]MBD9595771.1 flagellar hook-associated family protein [Ensifer sp. ENS05]MBD9621986.1 flagellar hook-associated family protein [Ensifer sp. ENS06]MBD9634795.1 flagellar hook-associated family protein [Ensifer sp. ENS07]USJ23692.1 flagellar hook-associated family protein [Ensifer adhaerens]UTV37017.1 flagellar hook-associated family protein [Ensifer adhaerens]